MSKGSTPSNTTVTQNSLPEYAEPYYNRLMERAEGLSVSDYTPYSGQRLADQSSFTGQSYDTLQNVTNNPVPYLSDAAGVSQGNIGAAQGLAGMDPYQFSQYGGFNQFDFGDPRQFTGQEVQNYMSPYIQNVLGDQMSNIRRQYNISQSGRDADAVNAGAYGGSRHGVADSLAQEDLMRQLDQTYSSGLQSAYEQAGDRFASDRTAQMDNMYKQAGEAGRVQEGIAGEVGRVQGSQAEQDLAARAFQLEAMGFSSDEAARLAQYGGTERTSEIQNAQLLEQAGKAQQQYEQAGLDISYDDFLRQQGYPEAQISMLAGIMHGVPVSPTQTTTTYTPSNPIQEALGMGISALGLYNGLTV